MISLKIIGLVKVFNEVIMSNLSSLFGFVPCVIDASINKSINNKIIKVGTNLASGTSDMRYIFDISRIQYLAL